MRTTSPEASTAAKLQVATAALQDLRRENETLRKERKENAWLQGDFSALRSTRFRGGFNLGGLGWQR